MNVCPHCGAVSRAERSALLVWRCGVCGGPVVPAEGLEKRDGGELASLVGAQRARAMGIGWLGATFVFGAIATMATGLALLVGLAAGAGATPALVLGALAFAAVVLGVLTGRRAARANGEARAKLEDAWTHVAGEVMRARVGDLTAGELARAMQTDETRAEKLLTRLSAAGRARVEVRDDADLVYRTTDEHEAEAIAQSRRR